MKRYFMFILLLAGALASSAQVSLVNGWKFKTGDSSQWASVKYNDSNWQPMDIRKPWEQQGHDGYDGFGWYRSHVVIPSSLKNDATLKDLLFEMGYGDDGYDVFLNGKLIGSNNTGDITKGLYGLCRTIIPITSPAILWDQENVLAVRIFDSQGNGGIYGRQSQFKISMGDPFAGINVNTDGDFIYGPNNALTKSVTIETPYSYNYNGTLEITVTDPETNTSTYQNKVNAAFEAGKPFTTSFTITGSLGRSSVIAYKFTDAKSGRSIAKSEGTPYILTPVTSSKPKINGPAVYGARPGNPFLYKIPVTGKKPLLYKADGLPAGLALNSATGIITGSVGKPGNYPIILTAHNRLGTATKKFTISIGDKIGLTPALGWNSWNAFALAVNDSIVRVAAKTINDKLGAYGWNYVNIDDGWEAPKRPASGEIIPNNKFPDMKALTDFVHSLGLKMGIYSSPGPRTCGGYLGSYQHEDQDAKTYGSWGMDYLKYDWCSYSEVAPRNPGVEDDKKPYQVMRASLDKVNRDIMFSFCQYGMGKSYEWAAEVGGNSWRTTGDIFDSWESMSHIGFRQQAQAPYAGPGHFNDPDMLVVGKVGIGTSQHNTRLSPDEQYTHISLWSMLSAPLLIGCDLGHLDPFTLNLLTNTEVLAIDQDELGKEATQKINKDGYLVYIKEMKDGKSAGIFNTSEEYKTITIDLKDIDAAQFKKVRDVWRQKYLIISGSKIITKVAPHGVMLVRFTN